MTTFFVIVSLMGILFEVLRIIIFMFYSQLDSHRDYTGRYIWKDRCSGAYRDFISYAPTLPDVTWKAVGHHGQGNYGRLQVIY